MLRSHGLFHLLCLGFLATAGATGRSHGAEPLSTNMDLLVETMGQAVDAAVAELETAGGGAAGSLLVLPQTKHAANWLVDHLLTERLLTRGFAVTLDSTTAGPTDRRLSYRILDLGVTGQAGLWGGRITRQSRATLAVSLSQGDTLKWQGEYPGLRQDRVPRNRVDLLENTAYSFAKTELKTQTWSQFVEPIIVSTVLGGLIYMFFSNR